MGFYEDFIEKYDKLVSFETRVKRSTKFYSALFSKNNVKTILDCACGTGHHVIMFNQMGFKAKGSDLSPAMIKKAKINAKKYNMSTVFKISDFMRLTKTFKNEKFDAVICIGNSLPHLSSDQELTKALYEMHNVLNKGGLLVLSQRNYDKLVKLKKRFFPVAIRGGEVFIYALDYFPEKIIFNVLYLDTTSKKFQVYSTPYYPLKKDRLAKIIRKVGFTNLKFSQDYSFSHFDKNKSDELIVVCKK